MYAWLPKLLRMVGSDAPDTILADIALRLVEMGVTMGISRPQMLRDLQIDEVIARNPMARLPLADVLQLTARIEARTDNPVLGLQIAERIKPDGFSDITYPIMFAPDVATAFQLLSSMHPHYQNVLRADFAIEDDIATLTFRSPSGDARDLGPVAEWAVAGQTGLGGVMLGRPLAIRHLAFAHEPRRPIALYESHFECPVSFEAPETQMTLDTAEMLRPSPHARPELLAAARAAHAMLTDWFDQGKPHLACAYMFALMQLDRRPVSLDRMAIAFGFSERTLRRHLHDEGLSFRTLTDMARQSLCTLYRMEGKLPLSEIATRLGYGEPSALSRSLRRWQKPQ